MDALPLVPHSPGVSHLLRLASASLGLVFFFCVAAAQGATFTVTKTADTDDGTCTSDCSLREAINAANGAAGTDAIVFDATAFDARQTIALNGSQLPTITTDLSITGTNVGVFLSGNGQSRVLQIGSNATVTLARLSIVNGNSSDGGGIYSQGVLTLDACTVSDNSAGFGGGIYSHTESSSKALTLRNSTVSGNRSTSEGAGLHVRDGKAILESATITRNVAESAGGTARSGGGIYALQIGVTTRVEVHNSIIVGNGDDLGAGGGLSALYVSGGYNLVGFGTVDSFSAVSDQRNVVNAGLSPLQDNGGPTFTHLPASGSAPVNAGDAVPPTDQRGVARPVGAQDDIGAVEYSPAQPGPGFIVNALGDGNDGSCGVADCTLREAIVAANANADSSDITFDPALFASRQTITLSNRLPSITRNASILGPASGLTINGAGLNGLRVEAARVLLARLHMTRTSGIENRGGQLTIRQCTISSSGRDAFFQPSGQTLLENSTFALRACHAL